MRQRELAEDVRVSEATARELNGLGACEREHCRDEDGKRELEQLLATRGKLRRNHRLCLARTKARLQHGRVSGLDHEPARLLEHVKRRQHALLCLGVRTSERDQRRVCTRQCATA